MASASLFWCSELECPWGRSRWAAANPDPVGRHEDQPEGEEQGGSPVGSMWEHSGEHLGSALALSSHSVPQASPPRKQILGNWQGFA